jgi:hypothetical protein
MTEAGVHSLRINRPESRRLALALALSLAAHLLVWGSYELGEKLGLWQSWHWPVWLHHLEKMKQPAVVQNYEEPLEFVPVEQPSTEAPKNAKYYSSQNSRAANPNPKRDTNVPQINGTQTEVPKAENVARPDFNKLQPMITHEESQPKNPTPSDLTLLKPGDLQQKKNPAQPRPRTIKQALAEKHLPGLQMRQEGGVRRDLLVPSFDVKQTPIGEYDARFVEAVQQRWDDLLDSQQFARDRTGEVTLQFHLNYDGSVTDMKILNNSVGDLLAYVCEKAVSDPAPFAPWTSEMREMIGKDYREITFTFYYY